MWVSTCTTSLVGPARGWLRWALLAELDQSVPRVIVAVGNDGRGVLAPCGRDRQVFLDYYPATRVLGPTADGVCTVVARERLPYAYRGRRSMCTGCGPVRFPS